MKKTLIAILGMITLVSAAHAEIRFPDQMYTTVICREVSGLPNGLSLSIEQGGFAGITLANLSFRRGLGPYVSLGSIAGLTEKATEGKVVYSGKDFELEVDTDTTDRLNGMPSHIYVDIKGQVYNQPMSCQFLAHTM